MRSFLPVLILSNLLCHCVSAQNFTGQWKGKFVDKSTSFSGWGGDTCEYVIDLTQDGEKVSGFSYTYFSDGGTRYYTICALEGFVDEKKGYVEVKEVQRTKTNVPSRIRNCFQVHKLLYKKDADSENLNGNWIPAPGQEGDCGRGVTFLSRRTLKQGIPAFARAAPKKKTVLPSRGKPGGSRPKISGNIAKSTPPKTTHTPVKKPVTKKTEPSKAPAQGSLKHNDAVAKEQLIEPRETQGTEPVTSSLPGFEKRNATVLRTIEVSQRKVQVDLYDNGEIDGDSISLIFNNKVILSHQRLSDKPISLKIDVDDDEDDATNQLIMYAENLGTIPPNTALMIVTDGNKRYEVRITSDLQKSGAIRFKLGPSVLR
jgi:hypothetical protein